MLLVRLLVTGRKPATFVVGPGLAGSAAFRHAMNQLQTCAAQLAAVNQFFVALSGLGERLTYAEELAA